MLEIHQFVKAALQKTISPLLAVSDNGTLFDRRDQGVELPFNGFPDSLIVPPPSARNSVGYAGVNLRIVDPLPGDVTPSL